MSENEEKISDDEPEIEVEEEQIGDEEDVVEEPKTEIHIESSDNPNIHTE